MVSRCLVLSLATVLCLSRPLPGQLEPGSEPASLGPLGGSAIAIAADPTDANVILVVQYTKGLFRSTDGGATFAPFGTGISAGLTDLVRDPTGPQRLYAIDGKKVFRSVDFGAHWAPLPLLSTDSLKGIALPATGDDVLVYSAYNIHHSPDGGATWTVAATIAPNTGNIFDSLAYAADGSAAYAGTFDGVWRSGDGGASFSFVSTGFLEWVQSVTVAPADPDTVLIGTPFNGIYRSTNGAMTFTPIGGALTDGNAEFFAWEPDGSRLWYGMLDALVYSTDGGNTWFDGSAGWPLNTPIPAAVAFQSSGARLFGCEGGGLYDQSGGGLYRMPAGAPSSWEHIGFLNARINDVAIAGPGGARVIGIGSGVYAAAPGETPVPTAWHADIGTDTRALAIDPTDPTRWLTGGVGAFFDNAQIVVVSDGGRAFAKTWEVFGAGVVQDIKFDPFVAGRVIAGVYPGGFGNAAIIRSLNGGNTWTPIASTAGWATRSVAFDPFVSGRVVQLSDNNQWSQSLNGGATWQSLQPALPASGPAVLLAFDPFLPGVIYRGDTGSGLWRSDNSGTSWNALGVSLHADSDLELHPQQPGLLWVSDANGKVLISADRGNSFAVALDVPLDADGASLALDTSNGALLVGTTAASTWELANASPVVMLGGGTAGTGGFVPRCTLSGGLPKLGNAGFGIAGDRFVGGALVHLAIGAIDLPLNGFGGTFHPSGPLLWLQYPAGGAAGVGGAGAFVASLPLPNSPVLSGLTIVMQLAAKDLGAPHPSAVVLSNALRFGILD